MHNAWDFCIDDTLTVTRSVIYSGDVECVHKFCSRFPFHAGLGADEIVAFQVLHFNSSPVVYLQFIADNELSDSFPEFEMLTRLLNSLHHVAR